jgi:hypothetical protein
VGHGVDNQNAAPLSRPTGEGAPLTQEMVVSQTNELIEAISELRLLFPDWRMGQLVANLVTAAGGTDEGAIWDMEDDKLLTAARRLIERNRERTAVGGEPTATADGGREARSPK